MPVWGAALLGVVALEAAFPPVEGSALVWLALAPLVLGLWRGPGSAGQWFSMGWGLGALHYAIQLLWLHRTLVVLGGVSWPAYALFHVICAAALGLGWGALLGWARWGWLRWGWWPGFTLPIGLALLEVVLSRQPFGGVVWGSLSVPLAQTLLAHHLAPWVGAPGLVLLLGVGNAAWALAWARPGQGIPLF
ncbi:MAG: hypothetical protein OEW39_07145, partial [Deltaproteobacteria bacterium]|nr:hypothetical protein [Deltaproteobacteria bacterium]